MGRMKDLTLDIEMLVARGYTLDEVAEALNTSKSLITGYYLSLTEPSYNQDADYMIEVE